MADQVTSVGAISLDLIVRDRVTAQVGEIAKRAQTAATKSFETVGQKAGAAVASGFSDAEVQQSLKDAVRRCIERTNAEAKKTPVDVPVRTVTLVKSQPVDSKAIQRSIDNYASKIASGHPDVDMNRAFTAAQAPADLLAQKMANLRDQMAQARRKSAEINAAFDKIGADGSTDLDKLSAAYTQVEARIISIQQQLDATKAKIDAPVAKAEAASQRAAAKAEAAAQRTAAAQQRAAERAAATRKRAADRAAAAQKRAAEKAANAAIRAVQREEKARAAALKRQQVRTRAAARAQAGSWLSAATTSAKGISRVGVTGRAALTSMRSLATAIPFAILAAGFGLLRKAITSASESSTEFKRHLNDLKANLQVAFTPIYQAILPALNQLMAALASAARTVASFVSGVFGKTYAQSLSATKSLQKTASTAKSLKRSLAGFDELNILSKSDSGSSDSGVDYDAISAKGDAAAEALGKKISGMFDFSKLSASFNQFRKVLEPIVSFIAEKIILPLSVWTINDGLPAAFKILSGAAELLYKVGKKLWDEFLEPIANWDGGVITTVFNLIGDIFQKIAANDVVCDILTKMLEIFIAMLIPIPVIVANWDKIKGAAENCWAGIKKAWGDANAWIYNKITLPIYNLFSGLVGGIKSKLSLAKSAFRDTFQGFVQLARNPLNLIVALINGMISGVNLLIRGLNKIHVDIPSWVPGIGGKSIGFSVREIGKIPYLANGGIASQPTLAMIGEYSGARSNPEVVAPLDKLQALMDGGNSGEIIELLKTIIELLSKGQVAILDGKVLLEWLRKQDNRQGRRLLIT